MKKIRDANRFGREDLKTVFNTIVEQPIKFWNITTEYSPHEEGVVQVLTVKVYKLDKEGHKQVSTKGILDDDSLFI